MANTVKDHGEDYKVGETAGGPKAMQAANDGKNLNQNKPGFVGSATTVKTNSASQQSITDRMDENSRRWNEAETQEERDRLHAENRALASQLGGSVTFNPTTGTWSGTAEQKDFSYQNAASYTDKYSDKIQSTLDSLLGREKFEYDAENDPLYQQYKQQYTAAGQQAMQDTLGQVSARTGGLASSYAGTASQQAYNNYMAQLANKVPELYQLAYSMYQDDLANDRSNLALLQSLSDSDYNRFNQDRSFDFDVWQGNESQRQWNENMIRNLMNDNRDERWRRESFGYQQGRDEIADQQWNKTHDLDWWEAMNQKQQQEISNTFTRWSVLGEADEEVSRILGVPVGTKTTDWRYQQIQMAVMQK